MTKRKKDKRTNNDLHNIHIKLKIEEHEPQKTGGEFRCSGRVSSFCSTSGTRRVNHKIGNPNNLKVFGVKGCQT
jgi:hypothetical protein